MIPLAEATASGVASDLEMVEKVLAGDNLSFELIMRRYNRRLYRIARGVLRNDADAEDVVQAYLLLVAHGGHHMAQIDDFAAKDYAAEAQVWDAMRKHMNMIADALAAGIAKQFPKKF